MKAAFIERTRTSLILVTLFILIYILLAPIYFSLALLAILTIILIFEWPHFFNISGPFFWLITPIYPILPFALMIYLNQHAHYHNLIGLLFLMVAAFDTGSYLIGSVAGRHLIAPNISPKKSWQGAIGGYLLATIALNIVVWHQKGSSTFLAISGISLIVCALALLGDLFESWLKRKAGIKDSGVLLPGHGGLLDRFDGIMFAVFFFYVCANWLTTQGY